jgi:hypothetical protein
MVKYREGFFTGGRRYLRGKRILHKMKLSIDKGKEETDEPNPGDNT